MSVVLCCLLWAKPGQETALVEYEDRVLALLPVHGATLLSRVRSDGADANPLEVQVFDFSSQASLDAYLTDPRRTALTAMRDAAVERTVLFPVEVV
jgi:uncharacterized protein (DUF1330 family)